MSLPIRQVTHNQRPGSGNPKAIAERKFQTKGNPRVDGLSKMQQIFVDNMLAGKTYRESATLAGYAASVVKTSGLISSKPAVKAALAKAAAKSFRKSQIKNERVVEEAASLALSNMQDYVTVDPLTGKFVVDLKKVTREQMAAVQELSYDTNGRPRIKLYDKKGSLDLLGKFLHMFTNQIEITNHGNQPITIQYLDSIINQKVEVAVENKQEVPEMHELPPGPTTIEGYSD